MTSAEHDSARLDVHDPNPPAWAVLSAGDVIRRVMDLDTGVLGSRRRSSASVVLVEDRYLVGTLDMRALEFPFLLQFVRCRFENTLDLRQSRLSGFELNGCWLPGLRGRSLNSDNDIALTDTTVQNGSVDLTGSSIRGSLILSGSRLTNPGNRVLEGERLELSGALVADRLGTVGELHLRSAVIAAQLDCRGARLTNADGPVLVADNARIAHDVLCTEGFAADGLADGGAIRLAGAAVNGRIDFRGARLSNPAGPTLVLDDARIANGIVMAEGFVSTGEVRLAGTTVNGVLDCSGGILDNAAGCAFNGAGMSVGGVLIMARLTRQPVGIVDLTRATVGEFIDDPASWPAKGNLRIEGFSYGRLNGGVFDDVKQRLGWIRRQPRYNPQPFNQLALNYRQAGHDQAARTVLVAREKGRYQDRNQSRLTRLRGRTYGLTLGYGYRLGRAIFLLPLLYLSTVFVIGAAQDHNAFIAPKEPTGVVVTASQCTSDYPCLSRWAYPIDSIVPIINLHQAEFWQLDAHQGWGQFARNWLYAATGLGWAATTLLVAAFTGLIRKD